MCEDYPCCGHEMNDCRGQKYGSDESIIAAVHARMSSHDYDPYYDDVDYQKVDNCQTPMLVLQ